MEPVSFVIAGLGVTAFSAAVATVGTGCAVFGAYKKRKSAKEKTLIQHTQHQYQQPYPYQQQYPPQQYYPMYQQPCFPPQHPAPTADYYPTPGFYPAQPGQMANMGFANGGAARPRMQLHGAVNFSGVGPEVSASGSISI